MRWPSNRQSVDARITLEAEYIPLAIWIKGILGIEQMKPFISLQDPILAIHTGEDNKGTINLAENEIVTD